MALLLRVGRGREIIFSNTLCLQPGSFSLPTDLPGQERAEAEEWPHPEAQGGVVDITWVLHPSCTDPPEPSAPQQPLLDAAWVPMGQRIPP